MIKHSIDYVPVHDGKKWPQLTIVVDGPHDVGRLLATLARGNVEHMSEAQEAATELRRTSMGRETMAYLESHGGPVLGHNPNARCDECGYEQYVSEEYGWLPINCPRCPLGSLYPRNENYAEPSDQEKQ